MKAEQISVFLENKAGRLFEVTQTLSDAKINIRALSLADTTDFGILRLIVDKTDYAQSVLKKAGFTVGVTSVVAVQVMDTPGGLNAILQLLRDANVNVEYMYAFVQRSSDKATMIFRFNHTEQAISALQTAGVPILPPSQIHG